MEYIVIFSLLFLFIIIYFKIADQYNIIDKPNHRSAHTEITLRGGGIIFPIAFILFCMSLWYHHVSLLSPQNYLIFGIGLFTISTISFIDDILDLSSRIRLVFHFISVTLLLYFVHAFQLLPLLMIPIVYIIIIGILNAFNFMDGINGMTGLYSLVTLASLLYVNQNKILFTADDFIIFPILACLVFLFFNFRKKAKCFMGDVGSMAISYWIIALIGLLIIKSSELKWLLFLTVYGTESVMTIIERIILKENIFEAHRRHLYQILANEYKIDHRIISLAYSFIQLLINIFIITLDISTGLMFSIVILLNVIVYLIIKYYAKKHVRVSNIKK